MTSATRALQAAGEGRLELQALVAALSRRYTVVSGPKLLVGRVQLDTFDRRLRAVGLMLEHHRVATGGVARASQTWRRVASGGSRGGPAMAGAGSRFCQLVLSGRRSLL